MPGNVIDDLQLKISANTGRTTSKIDKIADSLNRLAGALGNVSANNKGASGLTGLSTSLQSLSNINTKGINQAVKGLEKLSKIDLSNFNGKNLSININTGNIQQVTKQLSNFKKSASTVSAAQSKIATIGKLGYDLGRSLNTGFNTASKAVKTGVKSISNSLDQLRSKFSLMKTAAYSVKAAFTSLLGFRGLASIFSGLKKSIVSGGDLTEIDHIVESVFEKNMVDHVHKWADAAIESFGIASAQAKQYAGTLSSMFQASGVSTSNAGKMAMDLVGLAGDLSAFYNTSTAEAYEKLKSGMAGMVRPLRAFGIDLTAATLEEFRLAQGIETSYSAMSQAEKVMLRYQYLMANTTTQQGDFERTQYSLANATRTLKANISALSTQIGVGLAAALRPAVVALNQLMKYLIKAAQAFAVFMQTIFGKYKGGASGIAMEGLEDSADYADDLADGAGGAAGALEDADDAAKKLKKDLSVLPFDELNQLNKDREEASSDNGSGSGGGGGAGGGGGLGDLDLGLGDLMSGGALEEMLSEWGDRIKQAFKAEDWEALGYQIAWGLNKGIDKLYDVLDPNKVMPKVRPFINAFTTTFNSLVDNIKWEKLGRALGRGINDIIYIADEFIRGIDWKNLGASFAKGANGLVDEVDFNALGRLLGDKFMILYNMLYGFATTFDWKNLGKKLGEGINGLNEAIDWSTVASAIAASFNGIFETLREMTQTIDWGEIANNIVNGINTFIEEFEWARNGESLGMFISDLCDTLIEIIDRTDWEGFGQGLALALQKIPWGKMLKVVGKAIVTALGGILRGLATTPAGSFATALINALIAFKIGSKLLPFVNNICTAITSKSAISLLGNAASKLVNGGLSSITLSAGGSAVAVAGLSAALLVLVREIAKVDDAARGGNGMITELGATTDSLVEKLVASNKITGDQADSLFHMKEEAENARKSSEEFGALLVSALQSMGVPLSEVDAAMNSLGKQTGDASETFVAIKDAIENATDAFVVSSGDIVVAGKDVDAVYGDIGKALNEIYVQSGDINADLLIDQFERSASGATDAQSVYNSAINTLENFGYETETFKDQLKSMGYEFETTSDIIVTSDGLVAESAQNRSDLTTEALRAEQQEYKNTYEKKREAEQKMVEETIQAAHEQSEALQEWQNGISEFRDLAVEKLKDIGDEWGNLDIDQSETLEELTKNLEESITAQDTAIENMRQLNEAGLDDATVQAIIKQIDPSSEAMSDLIAHMTADDQTWKDFHEKLQTNLSMEDDIQKLADDMALTYAEKTKPAFVQMGEDTKVEAGKIGGFIVDGVVKGVYDSTDKAVGEMETLAYKMQDKYKKADKIGSPSKVYEGFAKDDVQGFVNGIKANQNMAVVAVDNMAKTIKTNIGKLPNDFKALGTKMVDSLKNEWAKIATVVVPNMIAQITKAIVEKHGDITKSGTELGKSFIDGLESGLSDYSTTVTTFIETLKTDLTFSLYDEGVSAGQSFADGFSSVNVPTPHMYISAWNWNDFGDGDGMYTPSFSVSWYKAGGLFKGGNGQIIGIAENNRDEAVLPLEDRRAMERIGGAIADAGGAYGDEAMMDRLAGKIAEAIILTQSDRSDPIFHIEVKTEDNETLARAVTKGQKQIDYRNNPTPAYGY